MQAEAQLAEEREARSKAKASFPTPTARARSANKAPTASSKRQATPPRPRNRDPTPPPSFWTDDVDTPAEQEPQWMLDKAKHTLAEEMAKIKARQEAEREEIHANMEKRLLERFRQDTRQENDDELESADTDTQWPALETS